MRVLLVFLVAVLFAPSVALASSVLAQGHITAGGPVADLTWDLRFISAVREARKMTVGIDRFAFESPGDWHKFELVVTDHGGIGWDLRVESYSASGTPNGSVCDDPYPGCYIPPGTATLHVVAYRGLDLDVTVLDLGVCEPTLEGPTC